MNNNKGFVVAWWSAGITSAVACKYALEIYDNVRLFYIGIQSAHSDNIRFMSDCEKWYGVKIETISSKIYKDQFDVIEKIGAVNTPEGAPCTKHLKKEVRYMLEELYSRNLFNNNIILNQVWGFEYDKNEINRAIRFGQQYPHTHSKFPLIEKGINKSMCAGILLNAGIEIPEMYRLGFNNNNCIGCVKGGMGYWNLIRILFPDYFERMAILERKIGYSCINGIFLDELNPDAGRMNPIIVPDCGIICEVEFADIPDKNTESVLEGKMSIYDAM